MDLSFEKNSHRSEFLVGIFVLLSAAALLFLFWIISDFDVGDDHYTIKGRFDNVQGISKGTKVAIAGMTVGQVTKLELDPINLDVLVSMSIDARYDQIPIDTSAAVYTQGLLGARYMELGPGGEQEYLVDGDELFLTQSAMLLEKLISTFFLNQSVENAQ